MRQIDSMAERLTLLRFPLVVFVVLIHADNREIWVNGSQSILQVSLGWEVWIRNWISQGIARTAVPLFFLLSGYLFYLGYDANGKGLLQKWKNRVRTLLLPFLLLNISAQIILSLILMKNPFAQGLWTFIDSALGIRQANFLFHLWFLRDLMVLMLFVPLWDVILRNGPRLFLLGIFILHICQSWGFPYICSEGILYFFAGAYWSRSRLNCFQHPHPWIILLFLPLSIWDASVSHGIWGGSLHRLILFAGVLAWIELSGMVQRHLTVIPKVLSTLAPASYFIYLVHEPFLRYCRYGIYTWTSPGFHLYWLPALLVIGIGLACYFGYQHASKHKSRISPRLCEGRPE